MLSILAFKKSLFAGVLDGGESEIFLGGTRLTKFMESVDVVTRRDAPGAMAATPAVDNDARPSPGEDERIVAAEPAPEAPAQENAGRDDPWAPLLSVGLKLLESFAAAPTRHAAGNGVATENTPRSGGWIESDEATGRSVLKLPLPEPRVLQQLAAALSHLVAGLGR